MFHKDFLNDGTPCVIHSDTGEVVMMKSGSAKPLFGNGGWIISPSFNKETTSVPWQDICQLLVACTYQSGMLE